MKIENINIVLPDKIIFGNLLIKEGKIARIRKLSNENIDCKKYILPGMIDPHVHLRDPGFPEKEDATSGTLAALNGGVTTIFDMPNTNPNTTNEEALKEKIKIFEKKAKCNWKLFVGASTDNLDFLKNLDNEKVAGIKIYMGSSTGNMLVDNENYLEQIFEIAEKNDLIISVHAESEAIMKEAKENFKGDLNNTASHSELRPPKAAAESVMFVIALCRKTGAKINICHVSTRGELELIKRAKEENLPITCEIAPHHLFLSSDDYKKYGNLIKVNPPVRDKKEQDACWEYLAEGVIDMIATDHGPHTKKDKNKAYEESPAGIPGLETALPLLLSAYHDKKLSLLEIAELYSESAAIYWDLNKGQIMEGKDADLIILDFDKEWIIEEKNLKTKCGWSPWGGLRVKGRLVEVILGGERI